jgi:tetraacyldisaccharide 4'-kinase
LILTAASVLYGAAVSWRRRWYARDPARRRRLSRPVVSIGNLSTGGSGKTPFVGFLAKALLARGERPAILTRGYRRRVAHEGVTVVSDGTGILAGPDEAGDEPFMLAQALPRVPVLVGPDRYLAGRLAERLGATMHILDDGFQHLGLARDVDLLLVSADDLVDRVLPAGRLREGLEAARVADALLVDEREAEPDALRRALAVDTVFRFRRSLGLPRLLDGGDTVSAPRPAFAVAGVARPQRFFADLDAAGWPITGTLAFRDHHPFTPSDVARIAAAARASQASLVLTTEKDAVRLPIGPSLTLPVASVPLTVTADASFVDWVVDLARGRGRRDGDRPTSALDPGHARA